MLVTAECCYATDPTFDEAFLYILIMQWLLEGFFDLSHHRTELLASFMLLTSPFS